MSVQVYRIDEFPNQDNSYAVGRTETWVSKPDCRFPTIHEAHEYIFKMTVVHVPYFTELALGLAPQQRADFLTEFCFTNDLYLKYRRFFIGAPPLSAMRKALSTEGVKIM
jgi:hypothetical protein